jgi:hypothetical protein
MVEEEHPWPLRRIGKLIEPGGLMLVTEGDLV